MTQKMSLSTAMPAFESHRITFPFLSLCPSSPSLSYSALCGHTGLREQLGSSWFVLNTGGQCTALSADPCLVKPTANTARYAGTKKKGFTHHGNAGRTHTEMWTWIDTHAHRDTRQGV